VALWHCGRVDYDPSTVQVGNSSPCWAVVRARTTVIEQYGYYGRVMPNTATGPYQGLNWPRGRTRD